MLAFFVILTIKLNYFLIMLIVIIMIFLVNSFVINYIRTIFKMDYNLNFINLGYDSNFMHFSFIVTGSNVNFLSLDNYNFNFIYLDFMYFMYFMFIKFMESSISNFSKNMPLRQAFLIYFDNWF